MTTSRPSAASAPRPDVDAALSARIFAAVDDLRDDLIASLQELVRTRSLTGDEGGVQVVAARQMADSGLLVDTWEPDLATMAPHLDAVGLPPSGDWAGRPNVVGTWKGNGGDDARSLILNAHIDTVEPGDPARWTHGPFSGDVADGQIWGRGSLDMKGGLSTNIIALRAIRAAGLRPRGDVHVESVIAEEDGGAGTVAALLRPYRADGAIITEPTVMRLVAATGGSFVFRITIAGLSAHAAKRDEGVSAIEAFSYLHAGLLEFEARRNAAITHPLYQNIENKVPLNIGTIRGGSWPSSVPEWVVAEGRGGLVPGETLEDAQREFTDEIRRISDGHPWLRDHQPVVEWITGQFTAGEIQLHDPLVGVVDAAHHSVTGSPVTIEGVTYGTDARHFLQIADMPCVVYGAGDVALAHQTDERMDIESLVLATRTIALAVALWCGVDEA
ncbi:MAG TPA: ArgE/DapE family deacylase [Thermomicrobiales bacterium]|jgi:acetylornithine deacetylase|nr:ArgE/DapE family deacylase [Thermomicrobiales bacterium]